MIRISAALFLSTFLIGTIWASDQFDMCAEMPALRENLLSSLAMKESTEETLEYLNSPIQFQNKTELLAHDEELKKFLFEAKQELNYERGIQGVALVGVLISLYNAKVIAQDLSHTNLSLGQKIKTLLFYFQEIDQYRNSFIVRMREKGFSEDDKRRVLNRSREKFLAQAIQDEIDLKGGISDREVARLTSKFHNDFSNYDQLTRQQKYHGFNKEQKALPSANPERHGKVSLIPGFLGVGWFWFRNEAVAEKKDKIEKLEAEILDMQTPLKILDEINHESMENLCDAYNSYESLEMELQLESGQGAKATLGQICPDTFSQLDVEQIKLFRKVLMAAKKFCTATRPLKNF